MPARAPRTGTLTRLAMAAAAIGLFLVAYYWGNQYRYGNRIPPPIEGVLIRPPPSLVGLELRDAAGQPFTGDQLAQHWTLLCFADPSRAPGHLAMARMIEVRNRLSGDSDLQERLQIALVAERQAPGLARDFERLSPAVKLLSGEVQPLREFLGAPPKASPEETADAVPLYLIGPSSRLLALFPGYQTPASIAADLTALDKHADSLFPDNPLPDPLAEGEGDRESAARDLPDHD